MMRIQSWCGLCNVWICVFRPLEDKEGYQDDPDIQEINRKKGLLPHGLWGCFQCGDGWMDLVAIANDLQLDLACFNNLRDGKMFVIWTTRMRNNLKDFYLISALAFLNESEYHAREFLKNIMDMSVSSKINSHFLGQLHRAACRSTGYASRSPTFAVAVLYLDNERW